MKKFDLVKLQNLKEKYMEKNLLSGMHGIVIECNYKFSKVLFFNEKNVGDYALVEIENEDLFLENHKLPDIAIKEIEAKFSVEKYNKDKLKKINFKEFDKVELLVEEERYLKFGAHKGDIGYIIDKKAVNNYVLVDFQKVNEDREVIGEIVSVKLCDLRNLEM